MIRNQRKYLSLAAVLLCAGLMFTACAPALPTTVEQDAPLVEEDAQLAWELEQAYLVQLEEEAMAEELAAVLLSDAPLDLATAIQPLSGGGEDLVIPTDFRITRPTEKLSTTFPSYFIRGTSNPKKPVYFEGEEIERLGTMGTFGVHVELGVGENNFTFRQGDRTETVTIVRTNATGGASTISSINKASMVPASMAGVKAGEKLSVGCIAPAGATIKASFGGKSVTLKQADTSLKSGVPATYTGKITVKPDDYDPDSTVKAEKVRYTMSYKGNSQKLSSSGYVYVAGEKSDLALEVTDHIGLVYYSSKNLGNIKETVKAGSRDFIEGQSNEYFKLASGGEIAKKNVKIVTGKVKVDNKISSAGFQKGAKAEKITITGTRKPFYDVWIDENTLHLQIFNTKGAPDLDVSGSRLLSSASVKEKDGSVLYKMPLKGLVWGFDVAFEEKDLVLTLKYKPTLGSSDAPLEGITIMLDPGHGGKDPGSLGVAWLTGPTEADVNLANALATRELLQRNGATVVMTRTSDKYVSLEDRVQMIEDHDADIFLSIHHNSLAESGNANKAMGMEVYYHTGLSKKMANTMMSDLEEELGRTRRTVSQDYYRVTLFHYAPSLLLELGFMPNPLEYEKAVTPEEMRKVANAIHAGIIHTLQ